jgi:medium-chain acyl-[acyl-carrier-protein] hydrolase
MAKLSATNAWVTCPKPKPDAGLRLFCFPYAGGGASTFRPWADALLPLVEVCPVQLPGRETRFREPAFQQLAPLIETLAVQLRPWFDRPFIFFGHSLGALIGFELVRALRRRGERLPVALVVSGRRAPQIDRQESPIHALPDSAFREALRRFNGGPAAVLDHAELMALLLPTLRADFAMSETYVYTPEPPLPIPLIAFGGLQDPLVSREHLEAWREQTTAPFQSLLLPGNHFFLHTAESFLLELLALELRALLNWAGPENGPSIYSRS